jgi:two-component system OmpR family response regulator
VRILLVEDSDRLASVVARALAREGHHVEEASTCAGAEGRLEHVDLAIVDVGLPDGSGLDLCRAARTAGLDLPILVLTARNGVRDRVAGLDAGGDDYLGKPFAVEELLARVRALGRRGPRFAESRRAFGDVVIDRDRRVVTRAGAPAALTPRELEIVALLAWRDGRVVPRPEILEIVWGDDDERNAASLDVLVRRIRRKLGDDVIRTVRNVGYAWAKPPSKPA